MSRMPESRRHGEGFLILGYTREADEVFKRSNEIMDKQSVTIKSLEEVIYKIIFSFKRDLLAYFLILFFSIAQWHSMIREIYLIEVGSRLEI